MNLKKISYVAIGIVGSYIICCFVVLLSKNVSYDGFIYKYFTSSTYAAALSLTSLICINNDKTKIVPVSAIIFSLIYIIFGLIDIDSEYIVTILEYVFSCISVMLSVDIIRTSSEIHEKYQLILKIISVIIVTYLYFATSLTLSITSLLLLGNTLKVILLVFVCVVAANPIVGIITYNPYHNNEVDKEDEVNISLPSNTQTQNN